MPQYTITVTINTDNVINVVSALAVNISKEVEYYINHEVDGVFVSRVKTEFAASPSSVVEALDNKDFPVANQLITQCLNNIDTATGQVAVETWKSNANWQEFYKWQGY